MEAKIIKLFLRLSIAAGFLSAVADRFGIWYKEVSSWGNWNAFLEYTQSLNPWFPAAIIPVIGGIATAAETVFALCLIVGYKTELFAKLTGWLLLLFGLAMTFSISIKAPLDYSVFAASAAAFALSLLKEKFCEIDILLS
ncbi:DoxX protein [Compostibacter hankyongensis]|uniref:DoxX family protein n=1 Tax=Compostibacter hankyongensis TaxID=1007089 RepID=A0ABP8FKC3_9BACT